MPTESNPFACQPEKLVVSPLQYQSSPPSTRCQALLLKTNVPLPSPQTIVSSAPGFTVPSEMKLSL